MKSKEELFNMPIVELREYMNSLSNPEILHGIPEPYGYNHILK